MCRERKKSVHKEEAAFCPQVETGGNKPWLDAQRLSPRIDLQVTITLGAGEQNERARRLWSSCARLQTHAKRRPNLGAGNQKLLGGKLKATGPPDPENPQAIRKAPPKPSGRFGITKYSKTDLQKRRGNKKG